MLIEKSHILTNAYYIFLIHKIQEQAKLSYADKIQKFYLRRRRLLDWKGKSMRNFLSNENVPRLHTSMVVTCVNIYVCFTYVKTSFSSIL